MTSVLCKSLKRLSIIFCYLGILISFCVGIGVMFTSVPIGLSVIVFGQAFFLIGSIIMYHSALRHENIKK